MVAWTENITMTSNRPTNGWDALIKIVEMLLQAIACLLLFLFMTPFGWIAAMVAGLLFLGNILQPLHQ